MHRGVASVWAMPRLSRIPARYAHTSGVNVVGARVTRKQLVFPSGLQSTSVVRAPGTYVFCVRVGIVCGCQNSTFKARGTGSRTE